MKKTKALCNFPDGRKSDLYCNGEFNMLIKRRDNLHIPSSEITSEDSFLNRRSLLKAMGILGALKAFPSFGVEERQIYTADADQQRIDGAPLALNPLPGMNDPWAVFAEEVLFKLQGFW